MLDTIQTTLEARGYWTCRLRPDPQHDELWTVIDGRAHIIHTLPCGGVIIAKEQK